MSINLLETIQQNLGYPPLQKIDPNTQHVATGNKGKVEHKVSQAIIPAVLTGLYNFVQQDKGAEDFLRGNNSTNWVNIIFADHQKEAIEKIADYTGLSGELLSTEMNVIASEAAKITKENLSEDPSLIEVKIFFSKERNNILLYLPAELNLGSLLDDNTLDDKTHKMQGPMSSLMQNIGSTFNKPVSDEEVKNR